MKNYASPLPIDREGNVMQEFAAPKATVAVTVRDNAATSSVTALNDATSTVEVTAIGALAGIRWAVNQATSVVTIVTGAAFDNIIPAGQVRKFAVPRRVEATTSVAALNVKEGLFNNIATIGAGSVLVAQYN